MARAFGGKVKALLEERGMSQRDFARKLGATEVTVSRYVNGKREPRIATILKIAEILNVTPEYLFGLGSVDERNCTNCKHHADSEAICILRMCKRAITHTVDAWGERKE